MVELTYSSFILFPMTKENLQLARLIGLNVTIC